jgi:hypothetical protein
MVGLLDNRSPKGVEINLFHYWRYFKLGERFGSGDGERKTLLTRQIAFEPLPASVLFGLGCS